MLSGQREAAVHGMEVGEKGITYNALLQKSSSRKNNISTNEANKEVSLK